jgi:cell division protein FtsQ
MPEPGRDILAHFGQDRFLERYVRYRDHIAQWMQQYPLLAAVDLRYQRQVVLQMASGDKSHAAAGDAGDGKPSADGSLEKTSDAKPGSKSGPKKAALKSQRNSEARARRKRAAARRHLAIHGAATMIGGAVGTGWGQ